VRSLVQDFQQILAVSDSPLVDVNKDSLDPREYEFPTGYHSLFGVERYQIPEYLFDPTQIRSANSPPASTLGVSNLIQNCLSISDPDIRPQLWSNIIVSGGNSCIHGFLERVSSDCTRRSTSSMKLKCMMTAGGPERSTERLFAAWTGGSILGSLGTFQNMWISRNDYEETGKIVVAKKCP
jgi:actin-related protein